MFKGRIIATVNNGEVSREEVGLLMAGVVEGLPTDAPSASERREGAQI